MSQIVVIKVFHKNQLISVKQFDRPQIVIGQQSDVNLVLRHKDVAPVHCVIEKRGDAYVLCDLGSDAGVEVNDQKTLEIELKNEDVISIGDLRLNFYIGIPGVGTNATDTQSDAAGGVSQDADVVASGKPESPAVSSPVEDATSKSQTVSQPQTQAQSQPQTKVDSQSQTAAKPEEESSTTDSAPHVVSSKEAPVVHTSTQEQEGKLSTQEMQKVSAQQEFSAQRSAANEPVSGFMHVGVGATASLSDGLDLSAGTYAPAASFVDLDEVIDVNSRGSVVEVMLTWKERIIGTYHFSQKQRVTLGNRPECDLKLSILDFKHEFINIDNGAQIRIPQKMDGFLYRGTQRIPISALREAGQLQLDGDSHILTLAQGEMVKCFLMGDKIQAYISYVEQTPKAMGVPMFDFTPSEVVAIAMSFIISALIALYMTFFAPSKGLNELDTLMEDQYRVAVIEFKPPPQVKFRQEEPALILDEPEKKPVVTQVTEKKVQQTVVQEKKNDPTKKPQETQSKGKKGPVVKSVGEQKGTPQDVAPNKETKKTNQQVSNKPGGAVGTGKEGANAETAKKDVTKSGLLSVISSGGAASNLDKVYSGAGTTFGLADSATGHGGQASDREGEGLGTDLKNVGAGGKGTATVGIAGVNSKGRGGGEATYGGAGGIGDKGRVSIINVEGNSGEFVSTSDKEAVRRVIIRNRSAIKSCYDVELTKNPNIVGKIVLEWEIVNTGKMRNAKVKSSDVGNGALAECIINRLRVLKFPDPGPNEIAKVAFPFVFEAR